MNPSPSATYSRQSDRLDLAVCLVAYDVAAAIVAIAAAAAIVAAVASIIGGPRVENSILCGILPNRFRTPLILPTTSCVPIVVFRVLLIRLAVFVRIRSTVADASEWDQLLLELGTVQSPGFVDVLVLLLVVACERAGTTSIVAAVNLTVTIALTVHLTAGTVVVTMTVVAGPASFRGRRRREIIVRDGGIHCRSGTLAVFITAKLFDRWNTTPFVHDNPMARHWH